MRVCSVFLWWMNDSRHGSSSPLRWLGDRERCYSAETVQPSHWQAGVGNVRTHTETHISNACTCIQHQDSPSTIAGFHLAPISQLCHLTPPPLSTRLLHPLPSVHVPCKWAVSLWAAVSSSSSLPQTRACQMLSPLTHTQTPNISHPINGSAMNISPTSGRREASRRRGSVPVAWGVGWEDRGEGWGDIGCQGASVVERWDFSSWVRQGQ